METESVWKVKKFKTIREMLEKASADDDKPAIVKLKVRSKSRNTYYPFEPMCVTATLLIRPWLPSSGLSRVTGSGPSSGYRSKLKMLNERELIN